MRIVTLALGAILLAAPVYAAGPVDPDWPCIQRKQPALSVAQIWGGPPISEKAESLAAAPALRELGTEISRRRTSLDEAAKMIEEFAKTHSAEEVQALFLATFAPLQAARGQVMAGITRYAHRQASLDAEINAQRREFEALMAKEPKDFDAIDKVEASIDWSTRIFLDRQQSLTYVCETPVILEQRAFALARLFAAALKTR